MTGVFIDKKELPLFTKYILRMAMPSEEMTRLYKKGIVNESKSINERDLAGLKFAIKHPWSIKFLDSGYAIISPSHELRHRLYIIFSLLEASTNYTQYFLPQKRTPLYAVKLGALGCWSLTKAAIGIVIIKGFVKHV